MNNYGIDIIKMSYYDVLSFIEVLNKIKHNNITQSDIEDTVEYLKTNSEEACKVLISQGMLLKIFEIFNQYLSKDQIIDLFIRLFPFCQQEAVPLIENQPELLKYVNIYHIKYEFLEELVKSNNQQVLDMVADILLQKIKTSDIDKEAIYRIFFILNDKLSDKRILYKIQQYLIHVLSFSDMPVDLSSEKDIDIQFFEVIDKIISAFEQYLTYPKSSISFKEMAEQITSGQSVTGPLSTDPISKLTDLLNQAVSYCEQYIKEAYRYNIRYYCKILFSKLPNSTDLINSIILDVDTNLSVNLTTHKKLEKYFKVDYFILEVKYHNSVFRVHDMIDSFDSDRLLDNIAGGFANVIEDVLQQNRASIISEYKKQKVFKFIPKEVIEDVPTTPGSYSSIEQVEHDLNLYMSGLGYATKIFVHQLTDQSLNMVHKKRNLENISYLLQEINNILNNPEYKKDLLSSLPVYMDQLKKIKTYFQTSTTRELSELVNISPEEAEKIQKEVEKLNQQFEDVF